MQVAYTLEQCWHPVPGGSALAALRVAAELVRRDATVVGVAGRHRSMPAESYRPNVPMRWLPVGRPVLYETWNRFGWPKVEAVTGMLDVCHSTVAIPAATSMPSVVTVHDVAFVHHPERFTKHGARVMLSGLERCKTVDVVCCPSVATRDALVELGFDAERVRVVPWGVDDAPATANEVDSVRQRYSLPAAFVLFVGTLEPRKNLARLVEAMESIDLPLVVAGAEGWGDQVEPRQADGAKSDVRFLGFVPAADLPALYSAATVFCYPSLEEGFGLPILESMAQGTPVVTSRGTATEEAAGGAAELVEPESVDSIRAGIETAERRRAELVDAGHRRAAACTWSASAAATLDAYQVAIDHSGGR